MPVLMLVLALPVFLLGRWGWSNAGSLVTRSFSESGRRAQRRAIRRGAACCQVVSVVLLAGGILLLVG